MAVHIDGIRSAYMHGISIVALVRTALVPNSWRKGLNTYVGIALAFPVVMAIGAIVSPSARHDWINAPSLIFFSLGIRAPARPAVTPYLLCSGDRRRGFRLARRDHNIGTQSFIPRR